MGRPLATQNTPADWQILPTSFEELCDRVSFDAVGTSPPKVLLNHPQLEQDGIAMEFTIRVQGVVAETNLSVLGNWTG